MDRTPRSNFRWRLFPEYRTFKIALGRPQLIFYLRFPKFDNAYCEAVGRFLEDATPTDLPGLNVLTLCVTTTSVAPSESLPISQRPVYLHGPVIGKGAYGSVYIVRNASTGAHFAAKQLYDDHRFGREWDNEIRVLKQVNHDNIVRFIDCCQLAQKVLIMEYLALGDLVKQHSIQGFTQPELLLILCQCLAGLQYMHARNIVHRDIKPQNILVKSRTPVHVQLADFGLARVDGPLKTFCGTERYLAPEIVQRSPGYTNAVDIWSIGVVFCEFMWGLPERARSQDKDGIKPQHHDAIIVHLFAQALDAQVTLVREHMLQKEPERRKSAGECLSIASRINIIDKSSSPGNPTTGRRSVSRRNTVRLSTQQQSSTHTGRRSVAQALTPEKDHRLSKRQRTAVDDDKHNATVRVLPQPASPGLNPHPAFSFLSLQNGTKIEKVAVRNENGYINATELLSIGGYDRYSRPFKWKYQTFDWDRCYGRSHPGIYTTPAACIKICEFIKLERWEYYIKNSYKVPPETLILGAALIFDTIKCGDASVAIRIADSTVNLTQILTLAGLDRARRRWYLTRDDIKHVSRVVQGGNNQGSYVDLTTARTVCIDLKLNDWHVALATWETQYLENYIARRDSKSTQRARTKGTRLQETSLVTVNSKDSNTVDCVSHTNIHHPERDPKPDTPSDSGTDADTRCRHNL